MVLREFLYLNDRLVTSYLEQLEGGTYEEEQLKTERAKDGSVGGELGFRGAKAQAGRKGASRDEVQRTVKQTAPSRFARLRDLLGDDVQELPVLDEKIWAGLELREVLDVQAEVTLPAFAKFMGLASQMEALAPLMEVFGQPLDEETRDSLTGIQQLRQLDQAGGDRHVTIIAAVVWSPRHKFVCHLDREYLQIGDPAELEGEANVFGVLQRKIPKGQTISLAGPLTGMIESLPRKERRKAEQSFTKDMPKDLDLGKFSVGYPAAVLNPIAVYR
jgi:hypothetical protein